MLNKFKSGAAIVIALLSVMISSILVSTLLTRARLNISLVQSKIDSASLMLFSVAIINWAKSSLMLDARTNKATSLHGPWSFHISNANISGGFISGGMYDAQAKFNINDLYLHNKIQPDALRVFKDILMHLKLPSTLANSLVEWLRSRPNVGAPNAVAIIDIAQLKLINGFNDYAIHKLSKYVIALPESTTVNINTASPALLSIIIKNISPSALTAIVDTRTMKPIEDLKLLSKFITQFNKDKTLKLLGIRSKYFILKGLIKYHDVRMPITVLYNRLYTYGMPKVVWKKYS